MTYTKDELDIILEDHRKWLNREPGGKRANLTGANLEWTNLTEANLKLADLTGAYLTGDNLTGADLVGANLTCANLTRANLTGANLTGAILIGVNLAEANLTGANLIGVNLTGTNLAGANLTGAVLRWANLTGAINIPPIACPETGSFIGYKKTLSVVDKDPRIVILEISADAKRSSATTRKCRCSKAKVIKIETCDGRDDSMNEAMSDYDSTFIYCIGETVEVDDFDDNRWNECAPGIHFFLTREEAVNWIL